MKEKIIIGITGPTGAGKTLALDLLQCEGFFPIYCDPLAHEVMNSPPCLAALVSEFGQEIANPGGGLNRGALGDIVFSDPAKLLRLNKISHPFIGGAIRKVIDETDARFFMLDAPTLIESGLAKTCDFLVVFTASEARRLERIKKRDNISREKAMARISAQQKEEFYVKEADIVIQNDGSKNDLMKKTSHLSTYIKNLYKTEGA